MACVPSHPTLPARCPGRSSFGKAVVLVRAGFSTSRACEVNSPLIRLAVVGAAIAALPRPAAAKLAVGRSRRIGQAQRRRHKRRFIRGAGICCSAGVEEAFDKVQWPETCPFTADDFRRIDETDDSVFYSGPFLTSFIDSGAISALTAFYEEVFPSYSGARILDMCASHLSHYPAKKTWSHVSITGMNDVELQRNRQADDWIVRDLNAEPELPYEDASFDVVTCTVSFNYLVKPVQVMQEVGRVLRPGGTVILSTSNRLFQEKAVKIWRRTKDDVEHCLIYGSYIHYSGAFEAPKARDITPLLAKMGLGDPIYVIWAKRSS